MSRARSGDARPAARQLHDDPARADPARRDAASCWRVSALVARTIPTEAYATATTVAIGDRLADRLARSSGTTSTTTGRSPRSRTSVDVDGFAVLPLVLVSCVVIVAALFAAGYPAP